MCAFHITAPGPSIHERSKSNFGLLVRFEDLAMSPIILSSFPAVYRAVRGDGASLASTVCGQDQLVGRGWAAAALVGFQMIDSTCVPPR